MIPTKYKFFINYIFIVYLFGVINVYNFLYNFDQTHML
jgi:hypothetical protein